MIICYYYNVLFFIIIYITKTNCTNDDIPLDGVFHETTVSVSGKQYVTSDISIESFINELDKYMHWYNEERIKMSLGGMSPLEYRRSLGIAT